MLEYSVATEAKRQTFQYANTEAEGRLAIVRVSESIQILILTICGYVTQAKKEYFSSEVQFLSSIKWL